MIPQAQDVLRRMRFLPKRLRELPLGKTLWACFASADQDYFDHGILDRALGDTLVHKQIAQIAYGYGVVPILRETL